MFGIRKRKRAKLRATPLPDKWWRTIDAHVPYIRHLSESQRKELGGIVQILLDEKEFVGLGGLEMNDEIRLSIAAQAAVLLLGRETKYFPTLKSILVYPSAYAAPSTQRQADGTVIEGTQARMGESWFRGSLVLSWNDVRRGASNINDGHNVVFHEFAHQLDSESGAMNGAPQLQSAACYKEWARVLSQEYKALVTNVHQGHRSMIDSYGATNPPEFFAVVTEMFFERPVAMHEHYPELYKKLSHFYQQDPAGIIEHDHM